jgi:lipoprotein-anchoring transpeptidase ErfK/SrfK
MGRKALISIVSLVMVAIVGAVGLWWYDSTYEGKIAEGVTIGGVDVGGMEADDARTQLRASLVTPLKKPVVARHGDEKFKLDPEQLRIRADIDSMVDRAVAKSREGNIFARGFRQLTGGEVDFRVRPQIAYDEKAVSGFVAGVAENLDRAAVDASVEPSGAQLEPVPSQKGVEVDQGKLRKNIEVALQDPADRKVDVSVDKIKPEVTTKELSDNYPTYLVVDRSSFELRLYKNLKLSKTYTIAIGAVGYDTPAGLYSIQNKAVDPVWNVPDSDWAGKLAGQSIPPGPDNPLKARWLGIYDGAGIHGTADTGSLGSAASHGCVRMDVPDVIDLYDRVDVGTPIYIA